MQPAMLAYRQADARASKLTASMARLASGEKRLTPHIDEVFGLA